MGRRFLELIGVLTMIVVLTVLLKLAPVPVAGQASTAPGGNQEEASPAAPTSWGEPDLQGIWTTDYEIPLQRPARFAHLHDGRGRRERLYAGGLGHASEVLGLQSAKQRDPGKEFYSGRHRPR